MRVLSLYGIPAACGAYYRFAVTDGPRILIVEAGDAAPQSGGDVTYGSQPAVSAGRAERHQGGWDLADLLYASELNPVQAERPNLKRSLANLTMQNVDLGDSAGGDPGSGGCSTARPSRRCPGQDQVGPLPKLKIVRSQQASAGLGGGGHAESPASRV
jgi:hypothetical protein